MKYPYRRKKEPAKLAQVHPLELFNQFVCKTLENAKPNNPNDMRNVLMVMDTYAKVYS